MFKYLGTLRARLLLGSVIPLVLFVGAASVAFLTNQNLLHAEESEKRAQEVLAKAYDVKANLAVLTATKRAHHLLGTEDLRQRFNAIWAMLDGELNELRNLIAEDDMQRTRVDDADRLARTWHSFAEMDFVLFARQAPLLQKDQQADMARRHLGEMVRLNDQILEKIDKIISAETVRLAAHRAETYGAATRSAWVIPLTLATAVILSILLPLQLSRTIASPLERLGEATNQLRQGSFTTLAPSGPSEIAVLIRYFNMMGMALSEREAILRTAERRYQSLLGSTSNLLWTMDARGTMVSDFAGWAAFTGLKEEEFQKDGWLQAVHPEDRERVARAWKEAFRSGEPFEEECRICRHDGVYRYFSCRCVPIRGEKDAIQEWVCACTDLTERRQEDALRREKEAAEAANQAKSDFLARMSHELRTPLNAIIGMSKMLSTQRFGPLNPKQADYIEDVTRAGEHLLALINDMLDISKVEAGHMQIQLEPVAIRPALEQLLSGVHPLLEARRLNVCLEIAPPEGEIVTDGARFKQVLVNLVSNAIKFTPEGGRVTVRALWVETVARAARPCPIAHAQAIRFEVEDTGIGIPLEEQETIWEEFHQASNRDQTIEGTGLGLALTRRLVHLLGGVIGVRSQPGQGSCFAFVLPRIFAGGTPERLPTRPTQQGRADGERPLALILEDHEPTNKLLADWLHDLGLRTTSAFTGPEGLERARSERPHLILLDLQLPRLDGWQVLTNLKADPATADIPVIVVTVLDEQPPRNLDVVDWFVKPLDHEHFTERLHASCPWLFQAPRRVTALIVDDDASTRTLLRDWLQQDGLHVVEASRGEEVLSRLEENDPEVMVLDLLMPGTDGFAVIERIRNNPRFRALPILVVTGKDITPADHERLRGNIQALLRKGPLSADQLATWLRQLGVLPATPAPPGSATE